MPKRIQRKRTKGWRMPVGAVYVGRPTKFGNPIIGPDAARAFREFLLKGDIWCVECDAIHSYELGGAECGHVIWFTGRERLSIDIETYSWKEITWEYQGQTHKATTTISVEEHMQRIRDSIAELRGKDLACFCSLDKPCHADVLLELANS